MSEFKQVSRQSLRDINKRHQVINDKAVVAFTRDASFSKGDQVEGVLFDSGTVVETGSAQSLMRYDRSGALKESIQNGLTKKTEPCVAVKLPDGSVAVYHADEVYKKK